MTLRDRTLFGAATIALFAAMLAAIALLWSSGCCAAGSTSTACKAEAAALNCAGQAIPSAIGAAAQGALSAGSDTSAEDAAAQAALSALEQAGVSFVGCAVQAAVAQAQSVAAINGASTKDTISSRVLRRGKAYLAHRGVK